MASPTILQGAQTAIGSTSGIQSAQRIIDMEDEIFLLEPDAAPLTVFTKATKTGRTAFSPSFSWLEDVLAPKTLTLSSDGGSTSLTLATGDGGKVATYDLVKNTSSGEIMLVTAIITDTLTVTRAFGVTAQATGNANDALLIIGNANEENQASRTILATQTTKLTNYCQIFRTPFAFSRTLENSDLYGGKYPAQQMRKKGIEHRTEMERQFLFGEPYEQTLTDGGRWQTGGIDYFIQSNRIDANKSVTYAGLEDALQLVFRYGNQKSRLGIAAPSFISKIDLLAEARLFHQTTTEQYGVSLTKVTSSHGTLLLVKHPLLQAIAAYNERCYMLDMDAIAERPFQGADTKLRMNIQSPDVDGKKHEYLTQIGLEVRNERKHAVMYNCA